MYTKNPSTYVMQFFKNECLHTVFIIKFKRTTDLIIKISEKKFFIPRLVSITAIAPVYTLPTQLFQVFNIILHHS